MPQHPCLWVRIQDLCLRARCKDPCFRIHVSAAWTVEPLQEPCFRTLYKIHVSGSMSPNLCLSSLKCESWTRSMSQDGSSTRSMSPDACLCVHSCVAATRWTKIDTALQRERFDTQETRRRLHLQTWNWHRATTRRKMTELEPMPNAKRTSPSQPTFRAGETQILTSRDTFFCGPAQGKHSVHIPPPAAHLNQTSPLPTP